MTLTSESEPELRLQQAIERNVQTAFEKVRNPKTDSVLVQSQKEIGPYRVDLLLNMWLIVEVDGRRYHDNARHFYKDRDRDSYFARNGFFVQRYSARDVYTSADQVAKAVIRTVLEMHDGHKAIKQHAVVKLLNGEDPTEMLKNYPSVEIDYSEHF